MKGRLCTVAPDAPDKVGPRVDQGPQQIVQPRVEVLRQRRDRLVPVQPGKEIAMSLRTRYPRGVDVLLQVCVRGRRYPEADTSWHRVARVQGFQLAAEQMGSETEAARVLVEHGHQIIRDHVLVGIFLTERTKFRILYIRTNC